MCVAPFMLLNITLYALYIPMPFNNNYAIEIVFNTFNYQQGFNEASLLEENTKLCNRNHMKRTVHTPKKKFLHETAHNKDAWIISSNQSENDVRRDSTFEV